MYLKRLNTQGSAWGMLIFKTYFFTNNNKKKEGKGSEEKKEEGKQKKDSVVSLNIGDRNKRRRRVTLERGLAIVTEKVQARACWITWPTKPPPNHHPILSPSMTHRSTSLSPFHFPPVQGCLTLLCYVPDTSEPRSRSTPCTAKRKGSAVGDEIPGSGTATFVFSHNQARRQGLSAHCPPTGVFFSMAWRSVLRSHK